MSSGDPTMCTACRGTGKLLSSLGGTPHQVVCPWCEGSGHRIPGIDAQEHPAEGDAEGHPAGGGEPAPVSGSGAGTSAEQL